MLSFVYFVLCLNLHLDLVCAALSAATDWLRRRVCGGLSAGVGARPHAGGAVGTRQAAGE